MLACCEGIALSKAAGLDPDIMVKVVSSGAGSSWALANLGPKIIEGDFTPGFMIDLLSKDLNFTMELAQKGRLPLLGTALARELLHGAQAADLGRQGTQALYHVIEKLAGGK